MNEGASAGAPVCFALLDDSRQAPEDSAPLVGDAANDSRSGISMHARPGGARLYTGFVRQIVCTEPADFDAACGELEAATAGGLHAIILADYEFGARLQRASRVPGVFRGLLFDTLQRLSPDDAEAWLRRREHDDVAAHAAGGAISPTEDAPSVAGLGNWRTDVTRADFDAAIASIHDGLRAGECYQINYTYRCEFDAFGSPFALYRRLRARQPVPYGALIALPPLPPWPAGAAPQPQFVLSLSPELFVRHDEGVLTAQPMKGTAAASGDDVVDRRRAEALAADDKNRAENLMIVDLLRNDLGRVAQPGSVRVPALFDVRRFAGVLQMTSTVTARVRPELGFADVFRALFPCGSITGAPKHRTMQLIETLERAPRGLYTGAIGWLDAPAEGPQDRRLGDFCLSVAIRTLCLEAPASRGAIRAGRFGVGAGIVLDSTAADEWEECRLKARFASALDPGFALLETMHATAVAGVRHRALHLARLRASAGYFGFRFDEAAVDAALARACAALPPDAPCRVRLALHHDGRIDCTHGVLAPLAQPVAVLLDAGTPWQAGDLFLRHKTTVRQRYDAAWRDAEARGAFDTLFFNQRGELTEGARSNVFIRRGGTWLTPPLASGVLPGVMRRAMLDDPAWHAREAVLTRGDLLRADEVLVCNALRGPLRAQVHA